jgi:hypothetical protein
MVGLGILKDIPGHSDSLCDIIPVDYVARQVLVSLAFASSEAKKTKGFLMISHCTSTSTNPVTWKTFFD